jgi:hypothetical protein
MAATPTTTNANNKTTMAPTAIRSNKVRGMLGLSLHGWENAMVVSLIIAGLFALVAGAATWAVVRLQRIEIASSKDEFERYKIEVGKQTDQLKKDTAVATARALEAQLALEKFKAPRTLTPEQRGRIVDKLKQFSGTEYDITISEFDPEIQNFVFTLELVLSTAGWTELDWKGTGEALIRGGGKQPLIRLGASVANVVIGVQLNQPPKLFEFALALSDALEAEGVTATAERHIGHEMSSTNANAIHIMIGRKQ